MNDSVVINVSHEIDNYDGLEPWEFHLREMMNSPKGIRKIGSFLKSL